MATNPILAAANQRAKDTGNVQLPPKLQGTIDKTASLNNSLMQQSKELMGSIESTLESSREAQKAVAGSNAIIQAAKDNAKIAQDQHVKKAATEADTLANQAQLRKQINASQDSILALQQQLLEFNNVAPTGIGLIDRPLRKIATRKIKEDLATQMQIQQSATQTYITNSEVIKEARSTAGEIYTETNEATAAANLAKIRQQATIDDNTIKVSIAQNKGETLARLSNMSMRGLQISAQEFAEQRAMMQDASQAVKDEAALLSLDSIKDEKLREQAFINTFNEGRILTGEAPMERGEALIQYDVFRTKGIQNMDPEMAAAWRSGVADTTGTDINSAIEFTLAKAIPVSERLKGVLAEAYNKSSSGDGSAPRADSYIPEVKRLIANYAAEIKDGDTDNINLAAGNAAVAQNTQVAANPLWERIVVARGLDVTQHSDLIEELGAEIQAGTVEADVARDFINIVYSTAKAQVDTVNNTEQLHIPRAKGYNARVKIKGKRSLDFLGTAIQSTPMDNIPAIYYENIDLTDPTDVTRLLTRIQILNPIQSITEEE